MGNFRGCLINCENRESFPPRMICLVLYVRPILEYAAVVWAPHTKCDIDRLEAVQRRAARFVTSDYNRTSSVTVMLDNLNWSTLISR